MSDGPVNRVVEQMPVRVAQGSDAERSQALREVMQEIALAGLVRRGFFGKSAFYGGTCLRIFHQLPRFSEDLDFSLLRPDPEFSLQPYLQGLGEEFAGLEIDVEIRETKKTVDTPIVSAFLKSTTTTGPPKSLSGSFLAALSALALVGGSHRSRCPKPDLPQSIRPHRMT